MQDHPPCLLSIPRTKKNENKKQDAFENTREISNLAKLRMRYGDIDAWHCVQSNHPYVLQGKERKYDGECSLVYIDNYNYLNLVNLN